MSCQTCKNYSAGYYQQQSAEDGVVNLLLTYYYRFTYETENKGHAVGISRRYHYEKTKTTTRCASACHWRLLIIDS